MLNWIIVIHIYIDKNNNKQSAIMMICPINKLLLLLLNCLFVVSSQFSHSPIPYFWFVFFHFSMKFNWAEQEKNRFFISCIWKWNFWRKIFFRNCFAIRNRVIFSIFAWFIQTWKKQILVSFGIVALLPIIIIIIIIINNQPSGQKQGKTNFLEEFFYFKTFNSKWEKQDKDFCNQNLQFTHCLWHLSLLLL